MIRMLNHDLKMTADLQGILVWNLVYHTRHGRDTAKHIKKGPINPRRRYTEAITSRQWYICVCVSVQQPVQCARIMRWWSSKLGQRPLWNLGSIANVASIYPHTTVSNVLWINPVTLRVPTPSPFVTIWLSYTALCTRFSPLFWSWTTCPRQTGI